ncbi:hypothetical protein QAD02_003912 [Eretmocerus hayati]|uniref:Uncharacterized protein n=1 Tax=Eretmocerus hayati TaxID=131215 RepID=A0ACC2NN82_9HYME|nr:hypothetical protein QAD02_003912 [Eretmocerus hayati]
MNPNRYPRKMYEKLRDTPQDSSQLTPKSNWYAQLQASLVKADHEYLLEQNSTKAVRIALPNIQGRWKASLFQNDVNKALHSTYNPFYRDIKDLDAPKLGDYLTLALPQSYVRSFAVCRLSGKYTLSFCTNKIVYKINAQEHCMVSTCNTEESLLHVQKSENISERRWISRAVQGI